MGWWAPEVKEVAEKREEVESEITQKDEKREMAN